MSWFFFCLQFEPVKTGWENVWENSDIVIVQSLSHVWLCDFMDCNMPSLSSRVCSLMSIESLMPSNHFILCFPFLLPSIFSSIRVFSNELALCIRWPKCWSFSFSLSPSNEYSGLISFGIDWFDFLAVQGTLKSFLQHHNSKALVLWCSAFFMVQLSDDYNSLWCKLLSCTLGSISFWKVLSLWALLQSRNRLLSWYKTTLIFSESDFMLWVPRTVLVYILYTFASPCILNLYQSSIY